MKNDPIIFSVDNVDYAFEEVFAFAEFRNDAAGVRQELIDALACECYAEEEGFELDTGRLQALTDQFRYERNLISAEEFENWLKIVHLELSQVVDHMSRVLWKERFSDHLQHIRLDYTPDPVSVKQHLWAHVVLEGKLEALALPLAQRLAVEKTFERPNISEQQMDAQQRAFLERTGLNT